MDQTLALTGNVAEPTDPQQSPCSVQRPSAARSSQTHTLAIENMHCGGCMRTIERVLTARADVLSARANLSQRRVAVSMGPNSDLDAVIAALRSAGFEASALSNRADPSTDNRFADLSRRLGVAAFATMNIMLLSVSVWSGAGGDMTASVQTLFHWLSALIALPTIAYSGQPFFSSAFAAVSHGRVNMDVPISIGVILTGALSLYQTIVHGDQVYFDAAVMLLTFLLLGRLLDHYVRARAATAASNLLKMRQTTVTVLTPSGRHEKRALAEVQPGCQVLIAAGERFGVDGFVVAGESEVDQSLITGESVPQQVAENSSVFAGTLNLTGPLTVTVTAKEDQSVLSEIATLLANAEQQRGRYVDIADRAARYYAPMVHTLAALTFLGWWLAGAGWETALPIAISVLIITCPCALALAVPAVQVAASGALLKSGVILKSPDALERLADCNTIVFDKTGTLTHGHPDLKEPSKYTDAVIGKAAAIAVHSTHPYSVAIAEEAKRRCLEIVPAQNVEEKPGLGLSATLAGDVCRLGAARWITPDDITIRDDDASVYLKCGAHASVAFAFSDTLKPDAARVLNDLSRQGYHQHVLSGDRASSVKDTVAGLALSDVQAEASPSDKYEYLEKLKLQQRTVLMVGDGLNDAPSLAAAHASMSPASAAHISQTAADAVFQGQKIAPVALTLSVAKFAKKLVLQNFGLATIYNLVFVPLAMIGHVTPLVAAIAMSLSSVSVTANALRVSFLGRKEPSS